MSKALTIQLATVGASTYSAPSVSRLINLLNTVRGAISIVFLVLSYLFLASAAEAAPQCGNQHNAMTAFRTGATLGQAVVEAKYGGISATLELGKLKQQLSATDNCLVSLIGEIDGVIEQVRNAPDKQQAINIVLDFEFIAANRVHDLCGCTLNPSAKMLYTIWTPPYGPGTKCMTAQEAEEYQAQGGNIVPLNQPCQ